MILKIINKQSNMEYDIPVTSTVEDLNYKLEFNTPEIPQGEYQYQLIDDKLILSRGLLIATKSAKKNSTYDIPPKYTVYDTEVIKGVETKNYVDSSDGNITKEDVTKDKIAYSKGVKIIGTGASGIKSISLDGVNIPADVDGNVDIIDLVDEGDLDREVQTLNTKIDTKANQTDLVNVNNNVIALETNINTKLDNKVNKIIGKELSTNDFTDTDKTKLNSLSIVQESNNIADKAVTKEKLSDAVNAEIEGKLTLPTNPNKDDIIVYGDNKDITLKPYFQLFIDMWETRCHNIFLDSLSAIGGYNKDTKLFYFKGTYQGIDWGFDDITYEEAKIIYQQIALPMLSCMQSSKSRINIPAMNNATYLTSIDLRSFSSGAITLKYAILGKMNIVSMYYAFYDNAVLEFVVGNIDMLYCSDTRNAFYNCISLKYIYIINLKVDLDLHWSPNLQESNLVYTLTNRSGTNSITITIHQALFNRLSQATKDLATSKNVTLAVI